MAYWNLCVYIMHIKKKHECITNCLISSVATEQPAALGLDTLPQTTLINFIVGLQDFKRSVWFDSVGIINTFRSLSVKLICIVLLTYGNRGPAWSPLADVVQHRERPAVRCIRLQAGKSQQPIKTDFKVHTKWTTFTHKGSIGGPV